MKLYYYGEVFDVKRNPLVVKVRNINNPKRTGIVTRVGFGQFIAERLFGKNLKRKFISKGDIINEGTSFGKACRWCTLTNQVRYKGIKK